MDPSSTATALKEFVELAMARRVRNVSSDDKARIEALDELLREHIDGARPAPKRNLGSPAKPEAKVEAKVEARVEAKVDAKAEPKVEAKAGDGLFTPSLGDLSKKLELSMTDRKKLSPVTRDQLPKSSYTPPRTLSLLEDYYGDIAPAEVPLNAKPTSVVGAQGDLAAPVLPEVRTLFGLGGAPREKRIELSAEGKEMVSVPSARAGASPPRTVHSAARGEDGAARAAPKAEPRGIPTIVHLMAGGTVRGHVEDFEPASGAILLQDDQGGLPSSIALEGVLAVFFGQVRGAPPSAAEGQRMVVKLVNDRQVVGLTNDYQEGGDSLTLVPEQRKGNVDRVWIPAWAVKEIQLG